jgi:hypothetical protein
MELKFRINDELKRHKNLKDPHETINELKKFLVDLSSIKIDISSSKADQDFVKDFEFYYGFLSQFEGIDMILDEYVEKYIYN